MEEKQYICTQDSKGKPTYREATEEELAAMQPQPLTWHYAECPLRITFSDEVKATWLRKHQEDDILDNHPSIRAILKYMKSLGNKRVTENAETHIYLEEIYPEHRAIIEAEGAIIETKPII